VKTILVTAACVGALGALAVAGAQARSEKVAADPGVTATTVTIGGSVPLSGNAAAYASVARGADAYFDYVNARGGVNGRKIVYKYYDDRYEPSETIQRTRQLIQEDHVFAVFNTLGTEQNLAIRPLLNAAKVPQVFPASGATSFGRDWRKYAYTTAGFQPSYLAEGRIYGQAVGQMRKKAKVAVLYQNDDYGKDVLNGLKQGLRFAGRGGRVVAARSYELNDVDVSSQVARLKSSGAQVLVIVATPAPAIRAYIAVNKIGWKPRTIVNAVSSASNIMKIAEASSDKRTEGATSIVFLKDPTDPQWARDRGGRLYRTIFSRYGTGNVKDVYNVYGMAAAYTFVEALRKAGRNLTRAGLLRAATSLNVRTNPFVLPGIVLKTTRTDRFPLEQARLERWSKGRWVVYGKMLSPRIR
jgi:branched-chain amino acid transport system substrate-binding protein